MTRSRTTLHALLLTLAALLLPAFTSAQTLLSQTTIGGGPRVVAVNPINNKVYIARHGASSVHVINLATGATHDVDAGFGPPTSLAVDPITGSVVVGGDAMAAVIDGNTDALKVNSGFLARANLGPDQIFAGNVAATIAAVVVNPPGQSSYYGDPANNRVFPGDLNGSFDSGVPAVPCPGPMAMNPVTGTLYIAETCNAALAMTSDNFAHVFTFSTPVDPLVTHFNPTAVAVNPVTGFVYVTLEGINGVQVIDNNTNPVIATPFENPTAVAVNPVTNKIYVANDGDVIEIDGATNFTTPIAVGGPGVALVALSVDNVHNKIYVANKGEGSIGIIDGASRVVTNLSIGGAPNSVAVNPRTQRVYAVDETNGFFTVIDDRPFSSINSINLTNTSVAVADPIRERAFFANGTHVVIVNGGLDSSDDGQVANVDVSGTVVAMAVDSISGRLFVAKTDATVAVIDANNTLVTPPSPLVLDHPPMTPSPSGSVMAANPATQTIYVGITSGNTQAIDARTLTIGTIRTSGPTPVDVAVDPARNRFFTADAAANGNFQFNGAGGFPTTLNGSENPGTPTSRVVVNTATGHSFFVHAAVIDEFAGNSSTHLHSYSISGATDIAVNSITNHVYVTDGTTTLHVLDPVSGTELTGFGLPNAGQYVSVDEFANLIYVNAGTSIVTIDGETGVIVASVPYFSAGKPAVDPGIGVAWVPASGPTKILVLHSGKAASGIQAFGDGTAIAVPGASGFVTSLASPVFQALPPSTIYTPNAPGGFLAHSGADDFHGPSVTGSFDGTHYLSGVPSPLATGLHYFQMFATDNMSGTVTNSQAGTLGANGGLSFLMGAAAVQPFVVIAPPSIPNGTSLLDGTEGVGYGIALGDFVSGGTGNNRYAVTSGALPNGTPGALQLDPATGVIFGTPSLAGTYPFTVTVTDDSGGNTSTPLSITIALGTPSLGVAPTVASFSTTTVGQSSVAQSITLFNNGWGSPTVTSVGVTGVNNGDFVVTSNACPAPTTGLLHAQNCIIQVTFSPLAAGTRQASLQIATSTGTIIVTLSGTAVPGTFTLTSAANGTGTGTITSSPAGINCPGTCSQTYNSGTMVTLTATPAAGSTFSQWTNCPSVSNNQCTVTLGADTTVTATFTALTTYNIVLEGYQEVGPYVQTQGSGSGTAVFDSFTGNLKFNISYSALTNNETDSHLYDAPRGANGPAISPMSSTPTKTDAIHLSPQQQIDLAAGNLYVNIQTAAFPNGEIRGQIDNLGATPLQPVSSSINGTGNGVIIGQSEAGGIIVCGLLCSANVPTGKSVTFTPQATSGSIFAGWGGACTGTGTCQVTVNAATTVTATFNLAAGPTTTIAASATSVIVGDSVTLTASVSGSHGTPTGNVIFQDGVQPLSTVPLDGSGHAVFTTTFALGSHSLTVKYSGDVNYAAATSPPVTVTVATTDTIPRLANISTRMEVLTGDNVMIAGFIIGGSSPKTVAIVATGPSLAAFGISNPLADPTLTLVRQSDHAVIATNDNWQTDPNAAQLAAKPFAPTNPLESAIVATLPPGAYTAIVSGVNGGTGVSVVAAYEMDHPEIPLINISTRGLVLTGNNVMIAGIIIQGSGPQTVVISATGPSLVPFGITNPLADPTLTLVRQSDSTVIATNDDWQSAPNAAAITSSGFAPTDPKESAIMVTLDPGAYTAIVQGSGGGTGVSVVGVFRVP